MKPLPIHILMIIATLLVSTSFPVGAEVTKHLDPIAITLVRFVMASLLFTPVVIYRHGFSLPDPLSFLRYSIISFSLTGFFWCMFEALRHTSTLNTSALFTLVPGIAGIISYIWLKEKLGWRRYAALVTGLVGALWVVFRGDVNRLLMMDFNIGDIIFLIGCFFMAMYTPLVRRFHRGEPVEQMTLWVLVSGVFWLTVAIGLSPQSIPWENMTPSVWGLIGYLALFTTVITFFIIQYATLVIGPTRVTSYMYLYPAVVLMIDLARGQSSPSLITYGGILIVCLSTVILQYNRRGYADIQ